MPRNRRPRAESGDGPAGEFYCAHCGGDRNYRTARGLRWLRAGRVPLLPVGRRGGAVVCGDCRSRYGPEVLDAPTCRQFVALLRDAGHTLALAALSAGGTADPAVRETACAVVRESGVPDCTPTRLVDALTAAERGGTAPTGRAAPGTGGAAGTDADEAERERTAGRREDGCGPGIAAELRTALCPLGPHLEEAGRARLLTLAARVALADGTYTPDERAMLTAAGRALTMPDPLIHQVLREASAAGR